MKTEWKVMLSLAGLLVVLECAARLSEERLSKDVQHVRALPEQAMLIRAAPEGTVKVLVLGNSLARCGVDVPLLKRRLSEKWELPVEVAVMHPDGSRIEEWAYGYRRYFANEGARPDVILMVTGQQHLTDRLQNVTGMGAFYVGDRDVWEFASSRLSGVENIARFFGARFSFLFAHRDRVEPLVFYNLVPSYAETAQVINRESGRRLAMESESGRGETRAVFQGLLAKLREDGVGLILATAPMPEPYQLSEGLKNDLRAAAVMLVDEGSSAEWPRSSFPDGYHLDSAGAVRFTDSILESWDE